MAYVTAKYQGLEIEGIYRFDNSLEAGYEDFEPMTVYVDGVKLPDIAGEWIIQRMNQSELTLAAGRAYDDALANLIIEGYENE